MINYEENLIPPDKTKLEERATKNINDFQIYSTQRVLGIIKKYKLHEEKLIILPVDETKKKRAKSSGADGETIGKDTH